jgi:hypothetical protein
MNLSKVPLAGATGLLLCLGSCTTSTTEPGTTHRSEEIEVRFEGSCPVEVVPDDVDCSPPYGGPGTVCRPPSANDNSAVSRLRWRKEHQSDPDFTIEFPADSPCVNAVGASGQCTIKKRSKFKFGKRPGLEFKYDVVSRGCSLDPYIIVMR